MPRRPPHPFVLAVLIAAATTASAHAQLPEVPEQPTVPDAPTPESPESLDQTLDAGENDPDTIPDTDYTPHYKETDLWKQLGGALYPSDPGSGDGTQLIENSPTGFDVELHAVSFRNVRNGLAAGTACEDPPERNEGEPAAEYGARVELCEGSERVPVVYRFTEPPNGDPKWEEIYRGSSPGYAGAVAWMPLGQALVVGGTGSYPRREESRGSTEPYENWLARDPAGQARAWLYVPVSGGGTIREVEELPAGMRGLSAVDFYPLGGRDLGFAGGLGQIWRWSNGSFDRVWDRQSPTVCRVSGSCEADEVPMGRAPRFLYRVREIRFIRSERAQAFAVTSGCCGDVAGANPRLLAYAEGRKNFDAGASFTSWSVRALTVTGQAPNSAALNVNTEPPSEAGERPDSPDSFYSFLPIDVSESSFPSYELSLLASPGGPRADGERPSAISGRICLTEFGSTDPNHRGAEIYAGPVLDALRASLSTTRLLGVDGDSAKSAPDQPNSDTSASPSTLSGSNLSCGVFSRGSGDGIPDWGVGERRATLVPGLGSQGVVYGTALRPAFRPDVINAGASTANTLDPSNYQTNPSVADLLGGNYEATTPEKLSAYLAARAFELPAYTLNALDVVGGSGGGWAVGDHGAIVRLTESTGAGGGGGDGGEPEPPRLGSRSPQALPDSSPYDAYRGDTPSGPTPPVPGLEQQPAEELTEGRLEPAGSPDATHPVSMPVEDVRQVVMSRDGTEGWALGPNELADSQSYQPPQTSLFHYRHGAWARCDPLGSGDLVPADPACKALAPLRAYGSPTTVPKGRAGVQILAAARIPLERDSDPSNDDEFEVAAITSNYSAGGEPERPAMLLYRDGRWGIVPREQTQALEPLTGGSFLRHVGGLAFSSPGEGWLLGPKNHLFRWDGSRWTACNNIIPLGQTTPNPAQLDPACEDPSGRTLFELGEQNDLNVNSDRARGIFSADGRVYIYGTRVVTTRPNSASPNGSLARYPLVIYRDQGETWRADPADTGLDPGFDKRAQAAEGTLTDSVLNEDTDQGQIGSLAVARLPDGSHAGWAIGLFGGRSAGVSVAGRDLPTDTMLRLQPGQGWAPFEDRGAIGDGTRTIADNAANPTTGKTVLGATDLNPLVVPAADGGTEAFIAPGGGGMIYRFNDERSRWELMRTGRPRASVGPAGAVQAVAPDSRGGFWLALRGGGSFHTRDNAVYFYRYTRSPPRAVFEEVANPFRAANEWITSIQGAPDGTLWAGTSAGAVARYDRVAGWQRARIPGWDPGRVVTRPSEVRAVAVNADGEGVAVGERGRIADLSPGAIRLDAAAGTLCGGAQSGPCGTGRNLGAVAIAPGGAALAGGERLTLLSRSSTGGFRVVSPPPGAASATITSISMPSAGQAWLTTDKGDVFAGSGGDGGWSWTQENLSASGELLSLDSLGNALPLRAIAVDPNGHGYAVGDRGLILERTGSGDAPWRRLRTPYLDNLTSVTLAAGGGPGALIGGLNGLILTASGDDVGAARHADFFREFGNTVPERAQLTGPVVGLALLPGVEPGQVEAWAAISGPPVGSMPANRLLHYTNAPSEPLLSADQRSAPLPDAPPAREGELSFAALGKSECGIRTDWFCPPMIGANSVNEVIAERLAEELGSRARSPEGPAFAVFTGDSIDSAGAPGSDSTEHQLPSTAWTSGPVMFRRWRELFADPIADSGLPLFGAIGGQEVSEAPVCDFDHCYTKGVVKSGDNLAWRQAMSSQPAPWGSDEPASGPGGVSFEPVPDSSAARRADDLPLSDPSGAGVVPEKVPLGGASTHYAFDVVRDGEARARIVVADNSLRSLAASDPGQQPLEGGAGQTGWLDSVLCLEGQTSTTGEACTRPEGTPAVVVAEAPTYSYGPGVVADTATDGAAMESLLLKHRVSAVVSGRLGWNALYYLRNVAGAPADHTPAPGGTYPASPPDPLPGQQGASLPFVIASGAGGKFGPDGTATGSAAEGFWRGYTIVRLGPSGDPAETVVEQRPLLDWIALSAGSHVLRAGQRLRLSGYGREPLATAEERDQAPVVRYDEISSPAVTHRYDLLHAEPDRPWLPLLASEASGLPPAVSTSTDQAQNPCAPYVCLNPAVGRVDTQSGDLRAGNGNYPRTYAVAQLSVGDRSASFPLVFQPRASFRAPAAPPPAPVAVPAPPPPSAPAQPTTPSVNLPAAPVIPVLTAQALAPPPVPPSPPTFTSEAPLDLNISPAALDVTPPTAVSQPPTPPVNPAPPSGARREARQRQAAAQKSGADSDQEASDTQEAGGDLANSPLSGDGSSSMTRHDFTAIADRDQPSAWARDALLGGGLGIAALLLALGANIARPTPRHREPEQPAPAWARRPR